MSLVVILSVHTLKYNMSYDSHVTDKEDFHSRMVTHHQKKKSKLGHEGQNFNLALLSLSPSLSSHSPCMTEFALLFLMMCYHPTMWVLLVCDMTIIAHVIFKSVNGEYDIYISSL